MAPDSVVQLSSRENTRLRILIADDNHDLAESLAFLLEFGGHDTRLAHNGVQATEAAGVFQPDLLLLDIEMPRMDGYEVAQWVRQQPWGRRALIVAITGMGTDSSKKRALEAGIDYYFTKPLYPHQLAQLVECAASRH